MTRLGLSFFATGIGVCAAVALHSFLSLRAEMRWRAQITGAFAWRWPSFVMRWAPLWRHWSKRNKKFLRDFPDLLDILGVGLSAGLSFEKALATAAELLDGGPLKEECVRVINDLSVGRSREEALLGLGRRLNEDRLNIVITIVVHSLKRGVPLGPVLFHQAESIRAAQHFDAEKRAQTAGLRLLFPMVLFIFPSLFLVLLGPLILSYISHGRLF